ncbi:hypothetical protein AAZX31_13G210100 [Glycine max]
MALMIIVAHYVDWWTNQPSIFFFTCWVSDKHWKLCYRWLGVQVVMHHDVEQNFWQHSICLLGKRKVWLGKLLGFLLFGAYGTCEMKLSSGLQFWMWRIFCTPLN